MPKRSTKPAIPAVTAADREAESDGVPTHRQSTGMVAIRVDQLSQRLDATDKQAAQTHAEMRDIKEEVGGLGEKIDGVEKHVGTLRVDVAKLTTTTEHINIALSDQRKIETVTMIAEIDDAADRRKARRAFWLRVGGVVLTLLGALGGMLIEHYR